MNNGEVGRDSNSALPVIRSLRELTALVRDRPRLFVRMSDGPETDRHGVSRDHESGTDLPGLSVNTLDPEAWWARPLEDWLARRLCNYAHLAGGDRRAWVLTGTVVARGPDNEPLVHPWEAVAYLGDGVLQEARRVYEERFDVGQASRD